MIHQTKFIRIGTSSTAIIIPAQLVRVGGISQGQRAWFWYTKNELFFSLHESTKKGDYEASFIKFGPTSIAIVIPHKLIKKTTIEIGGIAQLEFDGSVFKLIEGLQAEEYQAKSLSSAAQQKEIFCVWKRLYTSQGRTLADEIRRINELFGTKYTSSRISEMADGRKGVGNALAQYIVNEYWCEILEQYDSECKNPELIKKLVLELL